MHHGDDTQIHVGFDIARIEGQHGAKVPSGAVDVFGLKFLLGLSKMSVNFRRCFLR
jgi:hypothetical protein